MAMNFDIIMGLDLGEIHDYSAVAVLERVTLPDSTAPARYFCRHLQRWPLASAYPQIIEDVHQLVTTIDGRGCQPLQFARLVVDATGVGKPVAQMLELVDALAGRIVPVVITAGQASTIGNDGTLRVPKRELVSSLQVLLQSRRLQVAAALEHAATLVQELRTFRIKITTEGNETFEAWRDRDHDDLLMALAVAVWHAEKTPPQTSEGPTVLCPGRTDSFSSPRYGSW
jgi:hypothetical protein